MTHTVAWTIDEDTVTGLFTCDAGPGAWCRATCPHQCEEFELHGHAHPLTDSGHCNVVLWLNDGDADAVEVHPGVGPTPLHDGPVEVAWAGEDYLWRYPDETCGTSYEWRGPDWGPARLAREDAARVAAGEEE